MDRVKLYREFAEDCRTRALQNSGVPGKRNKLIAEAELWEEMAHEQLQKLQPDWPDTFHVPLSAVPRVHIPCYQPSGG